MEKYFTDNEGNVITRREWFQLHSSGSRAEIVFPLQDQLSLNTTREELVALTTFYNKKLPIVELAILASVRLSVDQTYTTKVIIYADGTVLVMSKNKYEGKVEERAVIDMLRDTVVKNIKQLKDMVRIAESNFIDTTEE